MFIRTLIVVFFVHERDVKMLLLLPYRCSLSKDAKKFFDSDTGVLEVPMTVQVAGQVCIILLYTAYILSIVQ